MYNLHVMSHWYSEHDKPPRQDRPGRVSEASVLCLSDNISIGAAAKNHLKLLTD